MKTQFWTGEVWGLAAVYGKICTTGLTGASPRVCTLLDCIAKRVAAMCGTNVGSSKSYRKE
jgi:hypothetical protein